VQLAGLNTSEIQMLARNRNGTASNGNVKQQANCQNVNTADVEDHDLNPEKHREKHRANHQRNHQRNRQNGKHPKNARPPADLVGSPISPTV